MTGMRLQEDVEPHLFYEAIDDHCQSNTSTECVLIFKYFIYYFIFQNSYLDGHHVKELHYYCCVDNFIWSVTGIAAYMKYQIKCLCAVTRQDIYVELLQ